MYLISGSGSCLDFLVVVLFLDVLWYDCDLLDILLEDARNCDIRKDFVLDLVFVFLDLVSDTLRGDTRFLWVFIKKGLLWIGT